MRSKSIDCTIDMTKEVYAIDFDSTLATYKDWQGPWVLGDPIPRTVTRVKQYLAEGRNVVIFTARVWPVGTLMESANDGGRTVGARQAVAAIQAWCRLHLGQVLPVTCIKQPNFVRIEDDRAVAVEPNTGRLL